MKIKIILYFVIGLILCSCKATSNQDEVNLNSPEDKVDHQDTSKHPINQEAVWTDKQEGDALENCIGSGNPEKYCSCSIEVLSSLFSYSEFKNVDTQIQSGTQLPPEVLSRMMTMGQRVKEECQPLGR